MESVNLREARRRLGELVDRAGQGDPVVITRRGKAVARLEPVGKTPGPPLPDLAAFRGTIRTRGRPLSQAVVRGRREARF
jgi:prevent-host-death family protein